MKDSVKKRKKYRVLLVFLFAIACACSFYLVKRVLEYQVGTHVYEGMRTNITVVEPEDESRKQEIERMLTGDMRAWIYCPNTPVDYPVMQGEDNKYYLNHLPNGERNVNGSIFLDYKNSADLADDNNILYGHHMKNGTMFATLSRYKSSVYYEQHPMFYLYTKEGNYRVELIAGYVLDGTEHLPLQFEGDERQNFLRGIKEKSLFQSEVMAEESEKLLTLVTCDYSWNDARYVLIGKMVAI